MKYKWLALFIVSSAAFLSVIDIFIGIGIAGGLFFNEIRHGGYVHAYQAATGVNILLLFVVSFPLPAACKREILRKM